MDFGDSSNNNSSRGKGQWVSLGSVLGNQKTDFNPTGKGGYVKLSREHNVRIFIWDPKSKQGGEVSTISVFKPKPGTKKAEFVKVDLMVNLKKPRTIYI